MRVCVPRESTPGEHRVALTPDAATKLRASGFDVVVERGAGVRAGFTDEQYTDAGITLVDHGQLLDGADAIVRVGKPTGEEIDGLPSGNRPDRLPRAADRHRGNRAAARARGRCVRHGVDPADHARAVDGRALVPGNRRRLQGRPAGGRPEPEALPDADDRSRNDRAGPRAGARRGRRRPAGDRDRAAPGGGRLGVRRAARRGRAGRVARGELPRPRRPRRGDGGRLRAGADRRAAAGAAGGARGAAVGVRRGDHDRRGAGAPGARSSSLPRRSSRCAPAR